MPRSGSTFSFNIARRLLEARGSVYQEPSSNIAAALQKAGDVEHLLLKCHEADAFMLGLVRLGAMKVVCTVRKPEDAIASWMTTFGFSFEQSVHAMEAWLKMFSIIQGHALTVTFDLINRDPHSAAVEIGRYLFDDADEREIREIASNFTKAKVKELADAVEAGEGDIEDLGYSFYNRRTFFHRRHVSSISTPDAAERIGEEQVIAIREALSPWCDADGNLV